RSERTPCRTLLRAVCRFRRATRCARLDDHEGGVTDARTVKAAAGWIASIAAFTVGLQLVWPTPFGIVVWGLVISSLTALLAFGLVLIYRSHRVINFAQADLGAVPASLCVALVVLEGWSYWVAVPVALLAAVALGSAV